MVAFVLGFCRFDFFELPEKLFGSRYYRINILEFRRTSRYYRETGDVKLYVLYRGVLRHTRGGVVSAQAVRADSAFVIRAQLRHLLLPIAHVRNQRISLD